MTDLEALRGVLLDPEIAMSVQVRGSTEAAVLCALHDPSGDGELHAVFTRRRDDLRKHAGEISFPGGRRDPEDHDLRATALREAHEEIGLDPDGVEILGALEPTPTFVTGFAVYPFVGLIETGQTWAPQEAEVAEVLEISLADLRAGRERRRLIRRGVPFRTDVYDVDGHMIWGATARMLGDLFERLGALEEPRGA